VLAFDISESRLVLRGRTSSLMTAEIRLLCGDGWALSGPCRTAREPLGAWDSLCGGGVGVGAAIGDEVMSS
jgi:hypothetical protein